ncbi:hypothetical protein CDD81_275 [Ophiocordyceps australis]|uniref:WSC domain-containing protein n=1 Tax=Ophiocordyceps australis TaxID=1399860 RepID=A0A2C5XGA1_9HYPO|nr:hypothetical protein CDD81_275 [Ophiocordyceps australis]
MKLSSLLLCSSSCLGLCSAASVRLPKLANGWVFEGCHVDVGRSLNGPLLSDAELTNEKCMAFCLEKGYPYAGTEYSTECFCGAQLARGAVEDTSQGKCDLPCGGDAAQKCGGLNRLSLYRTSDIAVPVENPGVDGWKWMGCHSEGAEGRALVHGVTTVAGEDMTVGKCLSACGAEGYGLAGVEYGGECYCGQGLGQGAAADDSGCDMRCRGNSSEYCGGAGRLSLYSHTGETGEIEERAKRAKQGVAGDSSGALGTGADLPSGWAWYGCWVDGVNGRILGQQLGDDSNMTVASCASRCAGLGFSVAGAEYHSQCFCGKQIINGGVRAKAASECDTACSGDSKQMCGGGGRMTIVSLGEPVVVEAPRVVARVGNWSYYGCVEDNVRQKRTFFWQSFSDALTPAWCLQRCAEYGYMAAGLEYGRECYCGDAANMDTAGARVVDDSQCNIACAGNASALCGGGSRLTTYLWRGPPLYSWTFAAPASPQAGSYDLLLGGVCIPLMTSQTVAGKVTFVEKWGTGPPNSTGAYELDLALVANASAAWREMHVKTDVFCAAGATLPDRAGRQLMVGGWSGDSTYGVRLYTPGGDWQENVDVLRLKNGRWYPSTMVMANGSILVIGGEQGSNGAPVPTLELLPPPPASRALYMDWLERTDPNNLYPFVCVLPSGGILAVYWNEARVLSDVDFSTLRLLPPVPGAVNDARAGRTYPLEGAAVLLPQRAPYSDPLAVLICGGSNEGPANALDNCVSISPDAPNPRWAIERMPSPRVMPCIAPLPDGTYLLLNGATHGVAGFGLGSGPNLNALLYNPAKPLGSRFTVMANTTVARMYHSEAITLLDGRVLVSGSDPQDGVNPQEYRVETFTPPYLLAGKPRPTFSLANQTDWQYAQQVSFSLGSLPVNGPISVSLLGSVSSTHGNSMGARSIFPAVSCSGTSCSVTAPPGKYICPPGWYQFFVLDGGIPAVGVFVRIGGDPAAVGKWPKGPGFTTPDL